MSYRSPLKLIFCLMLCLLPTLSLAEEGKKPQGPPPMLVEVSAISQGTAEPLVELVGSIHYARVSRVASEIAGIVEQVQFSEGARIKAGQTLVSLRNDLLQTGLAGTRANHRQAQFELERARKDLARIKALFAEKTISETSYDEKYYAVLALEQRVAALKAALDLQQLELTKTTIGAPFSGLVQNKLVEKGEWLASGGPIAVIADDRNLEVHVDVPQQLLSYLQGDHQLQVRCAGQTYAASFIHFIPQGDIATRTFTVKLKLKNAAGLVAGMEAHAQLPSGPKRQGLLVPRDAVLKQSGKDLIFLAESGKAKAVAVQIQGYQGMQVAIEAAELQAGDQVVVKGNERIRDGQAIRFSNE